MNILGWFNSKPKPPLPPPGPPEDPPGKVRDWTVLYYGNGNAADLDWDTYSAAQSWGSIGTDDKVAFAAQVARHSEAGAAKRLSFGKPRANDDYNVKVEAELGPTNMGDGKNLADFLRWGIQKYPARHYMVVLAGHGGAYQGGYPDHVAHDHLEHQEMKDALAEAHRLAGQPVDVLVHASCLMACAEAAHAVQDDVQYMVASEAIATTRSPNMWSLGSKLTYRSAKKEVSAAEAVNLTFESLERVTAESVMQPSAMRELTPKLKRLADALVATTVPADSIRQVIRKAINFGQPLTDMDPPQQYRQVRDLVSLATHLAKEVPDAQVQQAAQEVAQGVWGKVVINGTIGPDAAVQGVKGMSIFAPTSGTEEATLAAFARTPFARETGWDRVARKFG